MQTTLSKQIKAVQVTRGLLEKLSSDVLLSTKIGSFEKDLIKEVDVALNDVASTLAAIKMLKPSVEFEESDPLSNFCSKTATRFILDINKA